MLWESGVTKRMLSCGRWGMLEKNKNEKFNFHREMSQENCCGCSTGQRNNMYFRDEREDCLEVGV